MADWTGLVVLLPAIAILVFYCLFTDKEPCGQPPIRDAISKSFAKSGFPGEISRSQSPNRRDPCTSMPGTAIISLRPMPTVISPLTT